MTLYTFKLPDRDWSQGQQPAIRLWVMKKGSEVFIKTNGYAKVSEMAISMTKKQALALAQTAEIFLYLRSAPIAFLRKYGRAPLVAGLPTRLYGFPVHVGT